MLPKRGLASTLIQGSGVSRSPSSTTTYSRPSRVKPPRPLLELQRRRFRLAQGAAAAPASERSSEASASSTGATVERQRRLRLRAVELLFEGAAVAGEDGSGDRAQQDPLGLRQSRRPRSRKTPPGLPLPGAPRAAVDEQRELLRGAPRGSPPRAR